MKGQWIGTYTGSVDGKIMVNIDEVDDHLEIVAYVNPSNPQIPSSVAYAVTGDKSPEHVIPAFINPVNPVSGFQTTWNEIKDLFDEGVTHSDKSTISVKFDNDSLEIKSEASNGAILNATLLKPPEEKGSKIIGNPMTWDEFKQYVSSISKSQYLFRGQKEAWKLQTSFHRRGRYRVSEFSTKDVKQLHQRLSAITSHYFDLSVPDQNGSFFNLLQHHGYPTPLLDWSYSPYVSAFFAFRDWNVGYDGDEVTRLYIFDNEAWQKQYPQIMNIDPPFPHLSVMEFISIDNPRMVPQQAVTTVTNIVDIEAYILEKETETGQQFLKAIDIPANERATAMRDLRFMGITAGSMFPSIDGVCEELRELNFSS